MKQYLLQFSLIADQKDMFRVSLLKNGQNVFSPMYFPFGAKQNIMDLIAALVGYNDIGIEDFT